MELEFDRPAEESLAFSGGEQGRTDQDGRVMPALSNAILRAKLEGALPTGSRVLTGADDIHPCIANVPGLGEVRLYLWTCTADRSTRGRPEGEHKIQLILPAQRGRASLDLEGIPTYLLGYSPDFGVFVGWEARHYTDFAFSANVQVKAVLLRHAQLGGWAVAEPRRLRLAEADEVRVAFTPGNLGHFLQVSQQADQQGKEGRWREAFLLASTPNVASGPTPRQPNKLVPYVEAQRQRILTSRLARDARFAPRVRAAFHHACAVCAVQLEIIEAAHIIPVNETGTSDDVWNGLALCPNHHRLFDARLFTVTDGLVFQVDRPSVEFLTECNRAGGAGELLGAYDGGTITPPAFFGQDARLRGLMETALRRRADLAGLT